MPNRVISGLGRGATLSLLSSGSADVLVDVTGWFGGDDGDTFHPLQPTRVLDTRRAVGVGTTTAVPARGVVGVDLSAELPQNATAAVVTLTGTDAVSSTYVTGWPSGAAPATSDLNLVRGRSEANMGVATLDARRMLLSPPVAAAHLLMDVTGWFGPAGARTPH